MEESGRKKNAPKQRVMKALRIRSRMNFSDSRSVALWCGKEAVPTFKAGILRPDRGSSAGVVIAPSRTGPAAPARPQRSAPGARGLLRPGPGAQHASRPGRAGPRARAAPLRALRCGSGSGSGPGAGAGADTDAGSACGSRPAPQVAAGCGSFLRGAEQSR